jgi:hypothetical protein
MEERMNYKILGGSAVMLVAILFFCLGCTSPGSAAPTTYKEIFIDTYDPTLPAGPFATVSNYMELWSSDGKTRLAYYDGINNFNSVNGGYAYIDYTAGLVSGDYWVLVEQSGNGAAPFSYGIRVLSAPSSVYTGWTFGSVSSETKTDTPQPTVLEPVLQGAWPSWPPTTTVHPMLLDTSNLPKSTNHLNRNVIASGVNWTKITLP